MSRNLGNQTSLATFGVTLLATLAGPGAVPAEEVRSPLHLAFNPGVLLKSAVDEAVRRGVAEKVVSDGSKDVIRHLRLEVFEKSKIATKAQTTVFAVCESTFSPTLDSGRQLDHLTVEYMVLDASGAPVRGSAWRIDYKEELNKSKKLVWGRTEAKGKEAKAFRANLPGWA